METPEDKSVAESALRRVYSEDISIRTRWSVVDMPETASDGDDIETRKPENGLTPLQYLKKNHIFDSQVSIRKAIFYLTIICTALAGSRVYLREYASGQSNYASDDLTGLENSIARLTTTLREENLSGTDEVFLIGIILTKVNDIAKRSPTPKKRLLAAHTDDEETSAAIRRAVAEMRSKPMDDKTLIARCVIMIDLCMREMELSADEKGTGFSTDVRNELLTAGVHGAYPETGAMATSLVLLPPIMDIKDSVELEKAVREKLGKLNMTLDEEMIADLMLRLEEKLSIIKLHNRQYDDAAEQAKEDVASR